MLILQRLYIYAVLIFGLISFISAATEDIDECKNSTLNDCSLNSDCKNTNGSYECHCKSGFEGNGTTCADIDECKNSTLNDCSLNADCKNTNGSYECHCKSGFEGNGTDCRDIDECKNSTLNDCSLNSDCKNTNGSYECHCKSGFEGNGTDCTDIDECKNSTLNDCSLNADCKNTNGSYECHCKSGFEGNGTICADIDECKNSSLSQCSKNAICLNKNGSHECVCNSGYQGNGTTCQDVDECKNSTLFNCSSNADCKNTNGSYECHCKSGFEENGTHCTDIDECKNSTLFNCSSNADCKNTNGSYECHCKSGFEGNGTTCADIDECKNSTLNDCSLNADCKNTNGSYECHCKSGFEGNGTDCRDIDECKNSTLYNCSLNSDCKNTNGSYECHCKSGLKKNGTTCVDIDECKNQTLNDCSPNANCENKDEGYNCTCQSGFQGNGTTCYDVNECLFREKNTCSDLAICKNLPGTFKCQCKNGYKGNGTFCEDKNECLEGKSECDKNAECENLVGSYSCICKTGFRGNGKKCNQIPLFNSSSALNISKNEMMYGPFDMYGDINAFGFFFSTVYVSLNGYVSFGRALNLNSPPVTNVSLSAKVVLAPFWSQLDLNPKSQLFVDFYQICQTQDQNQLKEIEKSLPNFQAKRALVITWKNFSPFPISEFENETITFQLALVSNESQLYAIYNYDAAQINFNEEANNRDVFIGFYHSKRSSYERLTTNDNIYKWMKDSTEGFTGKRYSKLVGSSKENSMVCLDWFCENKSKSLSTNAVTPCPCSKQQAERDYSFSQSKDECYELVFPKQNQTQTCCYDKKWGALLLGYPGGGNTYNVNDDLSVGSKHCCQEFKLCNLFYEVYPSNNCSGYKVPQEVLIWDPLVFNLVPQQKSLFFYGSGEYTLIQTDRLKLQARIELKTNQVQPEIVPEFPIYTAFAIQYDDTSVEFTMKGKSISFVEPGLNSNLKIKKLSPNVLVQTPFLQIMVILNGDSFGLNVFLPSSVDLGQLGLISSALQNGTKLDLSLSENVFTTFENWKLTHQNESLFNYDSAKNFSVLNSDKVDLKLFQAVNANLTKILREKSNRSIEICGQNKKHCQLEFLLKNETQILSAEKTQMENQKIAENFPPVFEDVSSAVLVYKSVVIDLKAKDPENESISISLDTQLDKNNYQFASNQFNWSRQLNSNPSPTAIKFFAHDNYNSSSLYWPEIFLCNCKNQEECNRDSMTDKRRLRFPGRMSILPCNCPKGFTGTNCETPVKRCTSLTCYPNVICNESKADNPCGPCPEGMEGDGVRCYDPDQCSKSVCDQNCKDFLGKGYECSCNPGYVLAADNRTCLDDDECRQPNKCTKLGEYCANEKGGYSCKCKLGYITVNNSCLSLKGKTKLEGSLVFRQVPNTDQVWSEELKNQSSPKFKSLARIFNNELSSVFGKSVDLVEVTSFEKVGSQQKRKKRDTDPSSIKANYEAVGTDLKAETLENSLKAQCQGTYCGLGSLQGISTQSISLKTANMCPNSPCDPISTDCVEINGYECQCKPGFEKFPQNNERCKDINECELSSKPCGTALNCTNTIGSYKCDCEFGYNFDNKNKMCVDVCSGDVCNHGVCNKQDGYYTCSCKFGWRGQNCLEKDAEAEKMKINLIIVAAVLGSFCLLFLLVIIIICCRSKSGKSADMPDFYNPSSTSWSGLPRARLRDVELNENGSRMDLTKNSNHYDSLPGMQNPAFDPDDSRVDRC